VDIKTANNAGVVSIGVTWGYRDRKILEYAGADFIISEPMELFDLLEVNIHCNEKSKSLHKKL
jgi:phosphoglycolate phosphatase